MKTFLKRSMYLLFVAAAAACATTPTISQLPDSADPTSEIKKLESGIATAKQKQVGALAKDDMKRAEKQLKSAIKARDDNDDNKDILQEIAEGNAWLEQANAKADRARASLEEVLAVRKRALDRGAAKFDSKNLKKADKDLKSAAKDVQKSADKLSNNDRKDLLDAYLAIEVNAIRNSNLATSRANVKQAVKEDAEKYAPKTLEMVQNNMDELANYISANKDNVEGIQNLKRELDKRSAYLLTITREAKRTQNLSAEDIAIEGQASNLEQRRLARELALTTTSLAGTETALNAVEGANRRLMTDAELKQKYEDVKNKFSDSEAEVYLEGSNILIRLKGLNFPSGKAEVNPNSIDLLAKVEEALQSIGEAKVRVDGHTDSVGSKEINQKLSAARAETVETFLINKGVIDSSNIDTEGFGDTKPLATNRTKEGRAQNRRVDVVISPL